MTDQTDPRAAAQQLFDSLAQDLLELPDVEYARMFASEGLKVNGKFFAFPGAEGRLILKLPLPLPASGSGEWPRLMADAHHFVEALTASPE